MGWLLMAGWGCASVPMRPGAPTIQPLPPEIAAYYEYPRRPMQAAMTRVHDGASWTEWVVSFPLSTEGFEPTESTVELEWFRSGAPGRRPAIVFSPILGGDYPLERGICRSLAAHGFHVALIHRKTLKISPDRDLAYLELLLRQGIVRIRNVVDWLLTQEDVDPARLGSFGISMGGIAGVIVAAVEPRITAHVVALAGGPIADILLTSRDRLLTKPLRRYLAHQGLTRDTFEARLREAIRTDPIRMAPYVDARRMLMIIALSDRTIGAANALRLWRALGRPAACFFPTGHYTSYLLLPALEFASLRFFQSQFPDP